ncbi:uncharacterized protein [Amphiura filiformis]|uniref:uncharacterized protein n=1 Tax=Amphiura filiformis TaxID=82378 RepID=UPI003B221105
MGSHANMRFLLQIAAILIGVESNGLPMEIISGSISDKQMCDVCNCTGIDEYQFINCSSRHLQVLPKDFPANTVELNFEHNQIQSEIELPSSVLHLYGKDNQLTDIFGMFNKTSKIRIVDLLENRITSIPKGTFASCHRMTDLNLSRNPIKYFNADSFIGLKSLKYLKMSTINGTIIEADLFREIRHSLQKIDINAWRALKKIETGAFNFSLTKLVIPTGSMTYFPGGIFAPSKGEVQFDQQRASAHYMIFWYLGTSVAGISAKAFTGVRQVVELGLAGHSLKHLPGDLFANTSIIKAAYLENNKLEDLPVGFLRSSPQLEFLSLYNNRLKYISADILMGLNGLKHLYLFQNLITEIPPLTFYRTSLKQLCIFSNNISTIRNHSLDTSKNTLETIYMYYNDITRIEDNAFDRLANNTKIYVSTSRLSKWPHCSDDVNVFAVDDYINISLPAYNKLDVGMMQSGFQCKEYKCVPCKPGTYGDHKTYGCINCPAGGYFQERSGQVSEDRGGIGCKLCVNGTFVSPDEAPGRRAADCEVCPTGTKKNRFAGFRACPCLDGYYRKDRFGPCMLCPEHGINCTDEYQKLQPGFWWTWNWNSSNSRDPEIPQNLSTEYKAFISNLLIHDRSYETYDQASTRFENALPKPYPCLRGNDSCPASNGIDESCGEGYEGWLCSRCSDDFYSWFEYCIKCPPIWHLILEAFGVIILVGIFIGVTVWDIRRRGNTSRSLVDVLVARLKIVLGYYQIAGAIFTSLHNIHWPHGISNLATLFRALELNIFKIVAKPRCFIKTLEWNIYNEFVLGLIVCCLAIALPSVVYSCVWLYLKVKFSKYGNDHVNGRTNLKRLRPKCYLFVILILFISYPSLCDVILSLLPVACQTFCVDENNLYCTHRVRSDYSIDCDTQKHKNYIKSAYFALLYIVGFPLTAFLVILKNSPRKLTASKEYQERETDNDSNCTELSLIEEDEEENSNNRRENHLEETGNTAVENEETESVASEGSATVLEDCDITQMNNHTLKYPLYIRFLCENYKPEYWYWEIVELSRKVLQTSLVVLFGSGDPLTLGATIALSVVFITSHSYFKPMKDSFEHWLQMTSLVAIFLNLLCAEVLLVPLTDPSGYRQSAMAVFIISLNVSVVLLAIGNSILILWRAVKEHGRSGMCSHRNCLTIITEILSSVSGVSRNTHSPAAV